MLNRRGIRFTEFVEKHYDGERLPHYVDPPPGPGRAGDLLRRGRLRAALGRARRSKNGKNGKNGGEKPNGNGEEEPTVLGEELHEVARIEQINQKLKADYRAGSEGLPAQGGKDRFRRVAPDEVRGGARRGHARDCLAGRRLPRDPPIGGKGIDIKRFKGLGEMNAEQLWETTMNPETRMLLHVRLDDAGEADRLFSVLMGDDVEGRRTYIQDHALEVQNLDV